MTMVIDNKAVFVPADHVTSWQWTADNKVEGVLYTGQKFECITTKDKWEHYMGWRI